MTGLAYDHIRVKRLRRLMGRRSARETERAFVVEGAKVLSEALDARVPVESLYVATGTRHAVIDRALGLGLRVYDLAPGVIERVADTVTPQPILAVVGLVPASLEDLRAPLAAGGFVVVAVDVRDPGNAGTVIRSAEASGAAGVVLCDGSVEATNPKTLRASAGAIFHVPVVSGLTPAAVIETLRLWGVTCWATSARASGAVSYDEATLTGASALVVGNEAHGLSAELGATIERALTIPMVGHSESLNVGMATAVICFEAAKQRRLSAS